jgi:hypothetical protein
MSTEKELEKEMRETLAPPPSRCANCGWKESGVLRENWTIAFYSVQVHGPRNLMGAASIPLCNRCAWLMRDEVLNAVGKFKKETIDGKNDGGASTATPSGDQMPGTAAGVLPDAKPVGAGGGQGSGAGAGCDA